MACLGTVAAMPLNTGQIVRQRYQILARRDQFRREASIQATLSHPNL
jgi:hypothetical protein